jgi:hypothetical protein
VIIESQRLMLESCTRLRVWSVEAVLLFGCGAARAARVRAGVHEAGSNSYKKINGGSTSCSNYKSLSISLDQDIGMLARRRWFAQEVRSAVEPCKRPNI